MAFKDSTCEGTPPNDRMPVKPCETLGVWDLGKKALASAPRNCRGRSAASAEEV